MLLRAIEQTSLDETLNDADIRRTSIAASAAFNIAQQQPVAEDPLFVAMSDIRYDRLRSRAVILRKARGDALGTNERSDLGITAVQAVRLNLLLLDMIEADSTSR
ncbi:hypothetical protein [Curtobacterium flaccumfaciens]|uniref:hypothetical protein n=1 Tax=Curtobacterium flaccumfaciens TaxID=2035 RepID=UPI001BDF37D2|nr:hypothetical protein [Curtobacterium flaccumfaciens]MBT1598186.1 hypothetical protein [Curtobacterium flaccumfaciens pv. flaccumfaciens]